MSLDVETLPRSWSSHGSIMAYPVSSNTGGSSGRLFVRQTTKEHGALILSVVYCLCTLSATISSGPRWPGPVRDRLILAFMIHSQANSTSVACPNHVLIWSSLHACTPPVASTSCQWGRLDAQRSIAKSNRQDHPSIIWGPRTALKKLCSLRARFCVHLSSEV